MRLSEQRKIEAYRAIADSITDLRVRYYRESMLHAKQVDKDLFVLEMEIWRKLRLALNIQESRGAGDE